MSDYDKSSTREILIRLDERVINLRQNFDQHIQVAELRLNINSDRIDKVSSDVNKAKGLTIGLGAIAGGIMSWLKH